MRPCNPTAGATAPLPNQPRLATGLIFPVVMCAYLLATPAFAAAPAEANAGAQTTSIAQDVFAQGLFTQGLFTQGLFTQGQRAYRQGNFELAIDLYQRADRGGYADPVLSYNLGVAQYRPGDFEAAHSAFLTAAGTEKLAPLAYYNLGLVARKTGATRDAYVWFNQARRHPHASGKMQTLSRKAMATLDQPQRHSKIPVAFTQPERTRLSDHLLVALNTGFATDSNIYRSPSSSYVDAAAPGSPTVEPEVQSGTYIPMRASTALRWGTHDNSHFELKYALDGRIYSDSQHSNANLMEHEFSIGGAMNRPTKRGNVYWRSHFLVTNSNEQAYDRDDGQGELINDENVSDRLSSTRFGPDVYFHRDIGRFGYGFRMNAYIDRYEETLDFLDLTHEQYLGGAHLSFRPLRNTLVRISGDYYQREYADRVAADASGIRFADNDELKYTYQNLGLSLRQRVFRSLVVGLDYRYTQRQDEFENYDDYDRHTGRGYLRFQRGRFSARASYTYRTYDFPNALNFDDTPTDPWPLQTMYGEFEAELKLGRRYTIRAEAILNLVDATDPRSEYDRNQLSLGLTWRP